MCGWGVEAGRLFLTESHIFWILLLCAILMIIPTPGTHFLYGSEFYVLPRVLPEFGRAQIVLFAHVYGVAVEEMNPKRRLLEFKSCAEHLTPIKHSGKHKPSISLTLIIHKMVKVIAIIIKLLVRSG